METKSRYEILKELEDKKTKLVIERERLPESIKRAERSIKEMERNLDDEKDELKDKKDMLEGQVKMYNTLIEQTEASIKAFMEFNSLGKNK